jgi:hypothetical protein
LNGVISGDPALVLQTPELDVERESEKAWVHPAVTAAVVRASVSRSLMLIMVMRCCSLHRWRSRKKHPRHSLESLPRYFVRGLFSSAEASILPAAAGNQ